MFEFEFDGVKSSVFGLYIGSFDGSSEGLKTIGDEITVNSVKSPRNNRWIYTDSTYENPLTFSFQIFKFDCDKETEPIEGRELARIMRWLVRNDGYHYLRFDDDEWGNVFYNCVLKLQKYDINGKTYGFEVEATCNAPWGYSELKEYYFNYASCNDTNSYGKYFNLYNYSDEDDSLIPELVKIEILQDCTENTPLVIKNEFNIRGDENKKISKSTQILNCVKGEIIYLDKNMNISSIGANHVTLPNDFNYEFLELYSDFTNAKNTISVNLNCNITIRWREIRKGVCV